MCLFYSFASHMFLYVSDENLSNPKDSRPDVCPLCKGKGQLAGDYFVDSREHFAWRLWKNWGLDGECLALWKELAGWNDFRYAQACQVLHKIFKKEAAGALLR